MFTQALRSLSYSIPQFEHSMILPFAWTTCPHLLHVFEVLLVCFDSYAVQVRLVFYGDSELSE